MLAPPALARCLSLVRCLPTLPKGLVRPICLLMLLGGSVLPAQELLNRRLDLVVEDERIEDVLREIEAAAGVRFSYNYDLLPLDRRVSLNETNKRVAFLLNKILPRPSFSYREFGDHIVITRVQAPPVQNPPSPPPSPPPPSVVHIRGQLSHAEHGARLHGVWVKAPEHLWSYQTNYTGEFDFVLPRPKQPVRLLFSHPDFQDRELALFPQQDTQVLVVMLPLPPTPDTLEEVAVRVPDPPMAPAWDSINPTREVFMVSTLVKDKLLEETVDKNALQYRDFQLTLFPPLGTHGFQSGRTVNNFSFNLLVGYAAGTNGIELGGLLNVDRYALNGLQAAGLANVVGGRSAGFQLAGLFNVTLQQLAGFQVAGLHNHAEEVYGLQAAGVSNVLSDTLIGLQVAGVVNVANELAFGLQASGAVNVGRRVKGVQISPLVNVASEQLHGLQGGLVNVAGTARGVQLGLVNVADTFALGAPIGLLSFVRNGYNHLDLAVAERALLQARLKLGVRRFYNIFSISYPTTPSADSWAIGYGLGTECGLGRRLALNLDVMASQFNDRTNGFERLNLLNQLHLHLSWKFAEHLQLVLGPTFNLHLSELPTDGSLPMQLAPYELIDFSSHNARNDLHLHAWIGGQVGIRL